MAQILVRIVDAVNVDDPALNALCAKRGDVIAVEADDHVFGEGELDPSTYLVIHAANTPLVYLGYFLTPQLGKGDGQPPTAFRFTKFDLDGWAARGSPAAVAPQTMRLLSLLK